MKEHPIIFSGEMVRAILEGRKTMTRRVIKPQFSNVWGQGVRSCDDDAYSVHVDIASGNGWKWLRCPYGKPGDRLWVREKLAALDTPYGGLCAAYYADGNVVERNGTWVDWWKLSTQVVPSIHMPRWTSRITLLVKSVRVERVQDISDADIIAEGIVVKAPDAQPFEYAWKFLDLWNSINAKRGYGWAKNPWVWVIEFERMQ